MGVAGPSQGQSLVDWVREVLGPSGAGGTLAVPELLDQLSAQYRNLLKNGSYKSWSAGTTSAPDHFTLTGAGATIARDATDPRFDEASAAVTAALNTATDLAQTVTVSATVNARLRGTKIAVSCWVKCNTSSRVFLRIDDGVGTTDSEFLIGDSVWRQLTVVRTLDASATKLEVSQEISSGASITAYFSGLMVIQGDAPTDFTLGLADLFLTQRNVTSGTPDTTTSTAMTDVDSLSIANVVLDGNQAVLVIAMINQKNSVVQMTNTFALFRDSTQIDASVLNACSFLADELHGVTLMAIDKPAAGVYTYKARWKVEANTGTVDNRSLVLQPLPSA